MLTTSSIAFLTTSKSLSDIVNNVEINDENNNKDREKSLFTFFRLYKNSSK